MMRFHSLRMPALALTCAVAAHYGGGCSDSPASGTAQDAGGVETGPTPPARDAADEPFVVPQAPLDGWEAWPDYGPECGFYTPAPSTVVPPLTWEPCAPATPSSSIGCRQIKLDWNKPRRLGGGEWLTAGTKATIGVDGRVMLMTTRETGDDVVRMVVDADGPVRNAMREHSDRCGLGEEPSFGGQFAYKVYDSEATGTLGDVGGGAIGGTIGTRPHVLFHFHDAVAHSYVAGAPGVVQLQPGFSLNSWADGSLLAPLTLAPSEAGLGFGAFVFVGDTLHFNLGSLAYSRQKVWSMAGGMRDLLTAGDDATRGYGDLGTDGTQMVWSEGQRTDPTKPYPRLTIKASPYADSTAGLVPRTLRADVSGWGFSGINFVVGCGYAMRSVFLEPTPGNFKGVILVVRLSDGYAWSLPDGDDGGLYQWRAPLAVTCDEVFALVDIREVSGGKSHFNVARIRMDALGVPAPP